MISTTPTRSRKLGIGKSAKKKEWLLGDYQRYLLDKRLAVVRTHMALSSREGLEASVCAPVTLCFH